MQLHRIRFQNFRNLRDNELKNFGNCNLIYGVNGSGKSNFLEAIFVLSQASAMRPVHTQELIQWNQVFFYLEGLFDRHTISYGYSGNKKSLRLDQNPIKAADLKIQNPIFAFIPEDIDIIRGGPANRRRFLDQSLAISDGDYPATLYRYERALRQRNAQLKINKNKAAIWNKELIRWGSPIIEKRLAFVRALSALTNEIYTFLYGDSLSLSYLNTFKLENSIPESFALALRNSSEQEKARGFTLVGPHRDNFEIRFKDKDSKSFASQGQMRVLSLTLKLGALEYTLHTGRIPILLLDDVLLEIDSERREKFLSRVIGRYPSFLTSTSKKNVLENIHPDRCFYIEEGRIISED